jgi:hypothetical protein
MGQDNQPKVRQRKQLERKRATRKSADRILIVCEGSVTEPLYFKAIRQAYRLPNAQVVVRPSQLGTAPRQVVESARDVLKYGSPHEHISPGAFEHVYVVFDRDEHVSFHEALQCAQSLDGKLKNDNRQLVKFTAIVSVPCFELWYLLHFEEITHPIHRSEVSKRLRQYVPHYEKATADMFQATEHLIDVASLRAERLRKAGEGKPDAEPYTDVATLVAALMQIRRL